jgi:hypothetical protein
MICGVCNHAEYFLKRDGCSLPVREGCLEYGLYGTGWGCIQPLCPPVSMIRGSTAGRQ